MISGTRYLELAEPRRMRLYITCHKSCERFGETREGFMKMNERKMWKGRIAYDLV